MSIVNKLDELVKSVQEALDKAETLEKPPVSEAQRKAMYAAAAGNSTLGIPASVGKDFADADKGGKLPKKVKKTSEDEDDEKDKAEKADKPVKPAGAPKAEAGGPKAPKPPQVLDYSKMKAPKAPETEAPTISYSHTSAPVRAAGAPSAEAGFKVPKEKTKVLTNPNFRSHLANQRRAAGVMKGEEFGILTPEALTKSMRSRHSDGEITEMLKAAVDSGAIHRNVLLEWANFRTINPSIVALASDEE